MGTKDNETIVLKSYGDNQLVKIRALRSAIAKVILRATPPVEAPPVEGPRVDGLDRRSLDRRSLDRVAKR